MLKIQTCKQIISIVVLFHLFYLAANEKKKREKEMKEGRGVKLERFLFFFFLECEYFETECKCNMKKCVGEKIFMTPTAIIGLPGSEEDRSYFSCL